MKRQKGAGKVKSKVVHSSVPAIKELIVPVPPIQVQDKIAESLDNLQITTEKIKAELLQEAELRQKQYEYYRDKIFSFDE